MGTNQLDLTAAPCHGHRDQLQDAMALVHAQPRVTDDDGTLYEHGVRALERGLRFGQHGLPLMGCGDGNDGMNLVGQQGRGESVWLA
jgi:cellobiose phosphorylase